MAPPKSKALTQKVLDRELKFLYFNKKSPVAFTGKSTLIPKLFARLNEKKITFKNKKWVNALVDRWFSGLPSHMVHKTPRKKFERQPVIVKGVNSQFQMDLVDMQPFARENKGFKYILTIIDVFSKKTWTIPLKSKEGHEVMRALENFFKTLKTLPKKIQTDKGKEFKNNPVQSLLEKNNIKFFTSENPETKAQIVERVQKTLENTLFRMFFHKGSNNWVDNIQEVVDGYNDRQHSSIGMTPNEATPEKEVNILTYQNLKRKPVRVFPSRINFKVGTMVLIPKNRKIFRKGYVQQWNKEIFKVVQVIGGKPVRYRIEDMSGEEVHGTFYREELQEVSAKDLTGKKRTSHTI